jgi:hypothetical protein
MPKDRSVKPAQLVPLADLLHACADEVDDAERTAQESHHHSWYEDLSDAYR